MVQELFITADGSHSVRAVLPGSAVSVSYHSTHGALAESREVFIQPGLGWVLQAFANAEISVLEIGLGTGLNALLTALECGRQRRHVRYTALELYPLEPALAAALNYPALLGEGHNVLRAIHETRWSSLTAITPFFSIEKLMQDAVADALLPGPHHLIYLDAFSPEEQPMLWTEEMFRRLRAVLHIGGALVTYCSKSVVRRAMVAAGFRVEKLPGPRGKREMVRAIAV